MEELKYPALTEEEKAAEQQKIQASEAKKNETEEADNESQDEPKLKAKQISNTPEEDDDDDLPPAYQNQLVDDIQIQKALSNRYQHQSLAGMLVCMEQQKVTMFIKAHYEGGLTYSSYFLRINNQHFYLKKTEKQCFCINKLNGDLFIFTPGNLAFIYHFIITSKNEMTCINIQAIAENFCKPVLYLLQEPMGQDELLLVIENWSMMVIDIRKHLPIGILKLNNKKFRPIIYQDNTSLYLIAGKGSTSTATRYYLYELFNNRAILSVKATEIPIRYLNWGITQSSMHDAAICDTHKGLYIIGRKQQKTLQVEIDQNKNEIRIRYAPKGFLRVPEQIFFIQDNVAVLSQETIIYFSDDIQKDIIKNLKI